jgi:PAS domain-containing protein
MTLANTTAATEQNIVPNETLYRALFQNCLDGLMLTAPHGSIYDANPAACRIMGRTREEILAEGRQGPIDASDPHLAVLVAKRHARAELKASSERDAKTDPFFRLRSHRSSSRVRLAESRCGTQNVHDYSRHHGTKGDRSRTPMLDPRVQRSDLETYIRSHAEADFSHGICPDCRRKLCPETIRS